MKSGSGAFHLMVVGLSAELLRVHTELARHLDDGV